VALVEVVAGVDRLVRAPELVGQVGLALEAHLERPVLEPAESEHLPPDLEDRGLGAERELLDRAPEGKAQPPQRAGGQDLTRRCST
jgi:hypothetical protein